MFLGPVTLFHLQKKCVLCLEEICYRQLLVEKSISGCFDGSSWFEGEYIIALGDTQGIICGGAVFTGSFSIAVWRKVPEFNEFILF